MQLLGGRLDTVMNQAIIALLGAAIGSASAIAGSVITNIVAIRNENSRQKESRHAAYVAALRKEAATAFSEIYAEFSAIEQICWFAKNIPVEVNSDMVRRYYAAIEATDPRMMAALATVAGLNVPLHDELRPISRALQRLDDEVGEALRMLPTDRDLAISSLAACHANLVELDELIPKKIAEVMRTAERSIEGQ
ncbi:hypothetical protein [Nocardia bovistercoris]|uniref:Uncharacterized protein n=1 Tax=Nocardia bovistercoris TaxID=2785916 RepID=A0A931I848_9NOCA|nr:hypothetical protein [Nocardia bovistercoris]MBH0775620.1 hypothetical protein [Nocardia bovistercoris]